MSGYQAPPRTLANPVIPTIDHLRVSASDCEICADHANAFHRSNYATSVERKRSTAARPCCSNARAYADMVCTGPVDPPVAWVHPCNCTLVAHESCLLNWIRAAQQEPSRAPNALKCPQCNTVYEIESRNPFILRFLNQMSLGASVVGRIVTVCGVTGIIVSCSFGEHDLVIPQCTVF